MHGAVGKPGIDEGNLDVKAKGINFCKSLKQKNDDLNRSYRIIPVSKD